MVIRYYLTCEHCQKTTLLRIAVGYREKEPFYFECENCSQAISGNLLLDQRNAKIKGLEVEGATQIDSQEADYLLTYDPNFSRAGGEMLEGIMATPFLQMAERHDALESVQRLAHLNVIAREVVPDLGRIVRNYKSGNWPQFETGSESISPLICRALTLVTGLINLTHRNNHHAYLPHPALKNNFLPASMLRNAIGHNTISYNTVRDTSLTLSIDRVQASLLSHMASF